jgi:hypothetical protein
MHTTYTAHIHTQTHQLDSFVHSFVFVETSGDFQELNDDEAPECETNGNPVEILHGCLDLIHHEQEDEEQHHHQGEQQAREQEQDQEDEQEEKGDDDGDDGDDEDIYKYTHTRTKHAHTKHTKHALTQPPSTVLRPKPE